MCCPSKIKMENVSDKLEAVLESKFGIIIKLVVLMHKDIEMQLVIIVQSIGDVDAQEKWKYILLIFVLEFPEKLKITGRNFLQIRLVIIKEQTIQKALI